jgi:hypothetical protein
MEGLFRHDPGKHGIGGKRKRPGALLPMPNHYKSVEGKKQNQQPGLPKLRPGALRNNGFPVFVRSRRGGASKNQAVPIHEE